jgi:hypothetical protein
MKPRYWTYIAGLASLAATAVLFSFQSDETSTAIAVDPSTMSFQVRFGVTDSEPLPWDGELSVTGGEVVRLRSWHPRPGDDIQGTQSWKLSTLQGPNFRRRPVEEDQVFEPERYLWQTGLIVDVKAIGGTRVSFRTAQGNFDVSPAALPPGGDAFLNGRVVVDRVAVADQLSPDGRNADFASMLGGKDGEVWAAWVSYHDKANDVVVRRFNGSRWDPPQTVTPRRADVFLVQMGRDRNGRPWVVWSEQVGGNWDLYGRSFDGKAWSGVQRITEGAGPDIYHRIATDSRGQMWVVWQSGAAGNFDILARRFDGSDWSEPVKVSDSTANDWEPALAADGAGNLYVAWDTYDKGDYDIRMRKFDGSAWSAPVVVADTPRFEAHVTLACDPQGRVWAAWNESGFQWGKDAGFLLAKQATMLYRSRWMAVAVYENGQWKEPLANIEESLPQDLQGYNDLPVLQLDAQGRPWIFFRHRVNRFRDTPPLSINHRATWEIWGVAYEGRAWTKPQFLPFSQGRNDVRAGFALDGRGRVFAAWPMDHRDFQEYLFQRSDVFAGPLPGAPGNASAPELKPRTTPKLVTWTTHENEPADVQRLRSYTIKSGGSEYRIYRGDTHRHTEFSFDGNNDGSLLDSYRYALDAVAFDFLAVSDHNNSSGPDLEYVNYLGQQAVDLFTLPGKFVPLYGYERSVVYPNGHRNILFATRFNPTLPITPDERTGKTGAKMLYEYLKQRNGIAISHTSATNMGTDWRDNDPEVEPLVEIYQGDRVSAEHEGAPKAAYAGNPTMQPGGFRPAGYVWNAWAKGYKLGVQASSDHLSTHISYACTIATDFTREGLMDAMRKRHSYGATDNIVMDYRMIAGGKEYIQGDILSAGGPVRLKVKVIGTRPIRQIDIIRNNKYIHTRNPLASDVGFEFQDPEPQSGESYYYVRAIQVDDQIAWSSPIWVTRK